MPPMGQPQLKNEVPSRKQFLEKKGKKLETAINTDVSLIKQHWKKMAEIPQKHDFFIWSIQIL